MDEILVKNNICYLCGKVIKNDTDGDKDHIPPKSFIPRSARKSYYNSHNHQYITIHSHKKCNNGWNDIAKTTLLKFGMMATDPEYNDDASVRNEMKQHIDKTFPSGGSTRKKATTIINDSSKIIVARGFKEYHKLRFTDEDKKVFINIAKAIYSFKTGHYLSGELKLRYRSRIDHDELCTGFIVDVPFGEGVKGNEIVQGNNWFCYQIVYESDNGIIWFSLWNSFLFQITFKLGNSGVHNTY